jgi:hypothetical protein
MPFRKGGTRGLSVGKMVESQEQKMQEDDTKANWMRVRVTGLSNVLRMDFEEVFVRALDKYQIMQRIYGIHHQHSVLLDRWRVYELLTWETAAPSMHLLRRANWHLNWR